MRDADRAEVAEFIDRYWYSTMVVCRGRTFYPHEEEGFIERRDGQIVGLLTYHIEDGVMELLTLNSTRERSGIGSALLLAAIDAARKRGCGEIILAAPNDNLHGIGLCQRLGFRMVAIDVGAIDRARELKPQIHDVGERGIPIRDEVIMTLSVKPYLDSPAEDQEGEA